MSDVFDTRGLQTNLLSGDLDFMGHGPQILERGSILKESIPGMFGLSHDGSLGSLQL